MTSVSRGGGGIDHAAIENHPAPAAHATTSSTNAHATPAEQSPEGSTSGHGDLSYLNPEPGPSVAGPKPKPNSVENHLYENPAVAQTFDKKDAAGQDKMHQLLQAGLDKKAIQSQADTLRNPQLNNELKPHMDAATKAAKDGNAPLVNEHLGNAKQVLAKHSGGAVSEPAREWPAKSDSVYPHKGKHRPALNTEKASDGAVEANIKNATSKNGAPSLYSSSVARHVNGLEKQGYENGLPMSHDGFATTVHKFDKNIGADGGKMTPYMRLDGTDHGHPISKDQFDKYIGREKQKNADNPEGMQKLNDYLTKIGER